MKFNWILTAAVTVAQSPPDACKSECQSFDLNKCKAPSKPNDIDGWHTTLVALGNCACPLINESTNCQKCLTEKAVTASIFWSQLQASCSQQEAYIPLGQLWGIKYSKATSSDGKAKSVTIEVPGLGSKEIKLESGEQQSEPTGTTRSVLTPTGHASSNIASVALAVMVVVMSLL